MQLTTKEIADLSTDRTLMRNNLERISTQSVTSNELDEQQAVLEAVERKLARMEQARLKVREKIAGLRQQLAEARSRQRVRDTPQAKRALVLLTKKLEAALQLRSSMASDYRELKLLVRDQRDLYKSLKKKEEARQKAVAKFLKEWERSYDRETRMKEKTVRKRERMRKT
jgi:paraquat-inducible protein B